MSVSLLPVALLPVALLTVGAWLVWWGLRRRGALDHLPTDWRRVTGTVVDVGDGAARPPRIQYLAPDGRRLRVPGPVGISTAVGDEMAVLIDPSDFSRARLDLTQHEAVQLVRLLLGLGGLMVVVGAILGVALL